MNGVWAFFTSSKMKNHKQLPRKESTEGNRVISEWHFSVELFGTIDAPTKFLSTEERVKRGE